MFLFLHQLYVSIGEKMEEVVSDLELASLYRLGDRYFGQLSQEDVAESGEPTPASTAAIYSGLDAVVRQLNEAILNGPSITSDTIFAFAIPVLLVAVLTVMCLISNVWCAQDITVPEPAHGRRSELSQAEAGR